MKTQKHRNVTNTIIRALEGYSALILEKMGPGRFAGRDPLWTQVLKDWWGEAEGHARVGLTGWRNLKEPCEVLILGLYSEVGTGGRDEVRQGWAGWLFPYFEGFIQ